MFVSFSLFASDITKAGTNLASIKFTSGPFFTQVGFRENADDTKWFPTAQRGVGGGGRGWRLKTVLQFEADLELSGPHVCLRLTSSWSELNAVIMRRPKFARHDLPTVKSPNISHSLGYFCASLCELPRSVCECMLWHNGEKKKPFFSSPLFLSQKKQFQTRMMWR